MPSLRPSNAPPLSNVVLGVRSQSSFFVTDGGPLRDGRRSVSWRTVAVVRFLRKKQSLFCYNHIPLFTSVPRRTGRAQFEPEPDVPAHFVARAATGRAQIVPAGSFDRSRRSRSHCTGRARFEHTVGRAHFVAHALSAFKSCLAYQLVTFVPRRTGRARFEHATIWLKARRSAGLSYRPSLHHSDGRGLSPYDLSNHSTTAPCYALLHTSSVSPSSGACASNPSSVSRLANPVQSSP